MRSQASVSPDQISTFSNLYRHSSPLLTLYHPIPSSTNLYWPSTSQYHHILTQYHQVPLIIHHLMSHAQYTWSTQLLSSIRHWSLRWWRRRRGTEGTARFVWKPSKSATRFLLFLWPLCSPYNSLFEIDISQIMYPGCAASRLHGCHPECLKGWLSRFPLVIFAS